MKARGLTFGSALLVFAMTGLAQPVARLHAIVKSGDAVPSHSGRTFSHFEVPFTNLGGQIVFKAYDDNLTPSVWRVTSGTLTEVAYGGGSAAGGGTWLDFIGYPSINSSGQVAFRATTTGGAGSGIWRGAPGSLSRVVAEGDTAKDESGASLGGTFASFSATGSIPTTRVLLNSQGNIAFAAEVIYSPADFVGAWATYGGNAVSLVNSLETYSLPWGNGQAGAYAFDLNSSDVAATTVTYTVPGEFPTSAISRGTPGSLSILEYSGATSPDGTWFSIQDCLMNDNGRISTNGGLGSTFQEISVTLHDAVLAEGATAAPGTGIDYYDSLGHVPIGTPNAGLTNSDEVVYSYGLDISVAHDYEDTGVWAGQPGNLHLFGREGSPVQCDRSGDYMDFRFPGFNAQWINENGQFVVSARSIDGSTERDCIVAGENHYYRTYTIASEGDTVQEPLSSTTYGGINDLAIGYGDGVRDNQISGYGVISQCGVVCVWLQLDDVNTTEGIFTRRLLPGDLNNNGIIDVNDYIAFLSYYAGGDLCHADVDQNGMLNVTDYELFLSVALAYSDCTP